MLATSAVAKTPLDYIAEGYWQDFLTEQPIAGGIAYQAQLQTCQLDESLESLQRVDTLISQIRRDITKSVGPDEAAILTDEPYRNLLLFLAFYAGRVLAKQWGYTPHWYGQFELSKRYPDLKLAGDDFYQHMAVVYHDGINQKATALLFALEPIGLRLFGNIDRQFIAAQGGQVASGLYQAVSARLPNATAPNSGSVLTSTSTSISDQPTVNVTQNAVADKDIANTSVVDERVTVEADIPLIPHTDENSNTTAFSTGGQINLQKQSVIPDKVDAPDNLILIKPVVIEPVITETIANKPELVKIAVPKNKPTAPTPEIFTQLLIELDEIEVAQTAGNSGYNQACKILNQFERHISEQEKPRTQVMFSETHQTQRQQALLKLQSAANEGNTAAMLRLAMYELLGEGLTTDKIAGKEVGVEWVKQAANAQDSRAQRLLSKMYYQGLGVVQDIDNGRYWLEEAAKNGHAEAATVVAQWQQAQTLITTQKQEQSSFKRYQLLIGAVTVAAILLIILV